MSKSKPRVIPQWQRQEVVESPEENLKAPEDQSHSAENEPKDESESRASLIEQAAKFLQDEDIRDASPENKAAFLKSKGLTEAETQSLLETSSTEHAPTMQLPTSAPKFSPSSVPAPVSITTSTSPTSQPPPPIITYPEFLLHAQKPQPLLTTSRLLTTLYASSFVAAALYGTSTYLLTPMLESLNEARHSFFETAITNIDTLNEKLEATISTMPQTDTYGRDLLISGKKDKDDEDDDSETSDPTELFHRDIGIQTSPPLSPSLSADSSLDPSTCSPLDTQTSRLKALRKHLSDLLSSGNEALEEAESTSGSVGEMQAYMEDLRFMRRRQDVRVDGIAGHAGDGQKVEDEMDKVKKEIRGVKGVLLSARSFPAGKTGR